MPGPQLKLDNGHDLSLRCNLWRKLDHYYLNLNFEKIYPIPTFSTKAKAVRINQQFMYPNKKILQWIKHKK